MEGVSWEPSCVVEEEEEKGKGKRKKRDHSTGLFPLLGWINLSALLVVAGKFPGLVTDRQCGYYTYKYKYKHL